VSRFILRLAFAILAAALYLAVGWIVGLVLLVVLLARLALYSVRLSRALSPRLGCPAGHTVETHGRFRCAVCSAETLGSAWRCAWCGARHGFIACETCGEAVGNPLLR